MTTVELFSAPGQAEIGVLLMLRDVTAERELARTKEEFFHSVAHDLRAPLFAIRGYLRLLERVFANLVANALKATPRGGRITLAAGRSGPGHLEFSVSDTGPGIAKEKRSVVFEKFAQLGGGKGRLRARARHLPQDRGAARRAHLDRRGKGPRGPICPPHPGATNGIIGASILPRGWVA